MIRVLVVDDSATMRGLIQAVLSRDPAIEVVGQAADAREARQAIKALDPDVVTLDVEMPDMNGIEFLEKIMRLRPMPVIMVSSLTGRGAETALQALEIGAVDCIGKSAAGGREAFAELASKVKAAALAKVRPAWPQGRSLAASRAGPRAPAGAAAFEPNGDLVAIGSSTGGVEALITLIEGYPENCPPTVIAQHMPETFTRSFAERLNRIGRARVSEALDGAPILAGHVHLAPGGPAHLQVVPGSPPRCRLKHGPLVNGHRPSVDVLFRSVAKAAGGKAVGVILTGMGHDGAEGLLAMREAGARTIGQDEATCVVYGMPKSAAELGAVQRQLPLQRIAGEILSATNAKTRGHA
jgi:two-component system chemotaxis response regulator CheB